ncbi:hypothetical protein [Chitinophaga silvisoli]|uniref:Uncharacterized protein n=1 Tax=Chitinophaga silvisoli TaxID=2291814 RepID=A0A3E1NXL7_9BACT|nr:hypothetical protein [Chitinophaga silvisoli]RFM32669.1 hypothetical protein DXN04_23660 [Chitinophaga silvisoli]
MKLFQEMQNIILKVISTIIVSILLGVFIPGIVMHYNHSFSEEDVVSKLKPNNKKQYELYKQVNYQIANRRDSLLSNLKDSAILENHACLDSIITEISNLDELHNKIHSPIIIAPFYPRNKVLILFPLAYLGSMLLLLFPLNFRFKLKRSMYVLILFLLILMARWPTWMRNTSLGNIDRHVFSVNNYDISRLGFFVQEVQVLIYLVILTYIVCKWFSYTNHLIARFKSRYILSESYIMSVYDQLRKRYMEWQLASFFLALAFGYYTYYFWSTISESHDYRYLPQAIMTHILWGLLWLIISFPLIISKHYQLRLRTNYLQRAAGNSLTPEQTIRIKEILSIDPISSQNQVISTLIGGITFLFPLIKSFF